MGITGTLQNDTLAGTISDDLIQGLDGRDDLSGDDGTDTLEGGSGGDALTGALGDDLLDGGDGYDVAPYAGVRSGYTVADLGGGSYIVTDNSTGDGTDTLHGIEALQFADGTLALAKAVDRDFNADGLSDFLLFETGTGGFNLSSSDGVTVSSLAMPPDANWQLRAVEDFNGDGTADVLFRNSTDGSTYLYQMDGDSIIHDEVFATSLTTWDVALTGDFDGDHIADVMMWNETLGVAFAQHFDGTTVTGAPVAWGAPADHWSIAGAGDFDGDGRSDLLFRSDDLGVMYVKTMNGLTDTENGRSVIWNTNADWTVAGIGDFDGDGKDDVLLQDDARGVARLYLMDGINEAVGENVTFAPAEWELNSIADFNGDGKSDILYRNATDGKAFVYLMDGFTILDKGVLNAPGVTADWQVAAVRDFNGDGKADIVFRDEAGGHATLNHYDGLTLLDDQVSDIAAGWQLV